MHILFVRTTEFILSIQNITSDINYYVYINYMLWMKTLIIKWRIKFYQILHVQLLFLYIITCYFDTSTLIGR